MIPPKDIEIEDYNYPLPNERIAKYPLQERDHSKLLLYRQGEISHTSFYNIGDYLPDNSLLVFNDTKVIHARLFFSKETGAVIEIFCLEPWQMPASQSFEQRERCQWKCLIGHNKKWKEGPLTRTIEVEGKRVVLTATRKEAVGEAWVVEFEWTEGVPFASVIEVAGVIPLPPYLHREAEESDETRYQTVYAEHEGSVAAPTAGLHFTPELLQKLRLKGIGTEFITLQVGAGTFKPVSTTTIGDHVMHVEQVQLSRHNIERLLSHGTGPIIPVGTTTVRTLESVYWFGVQLQQNPDLEAMSIKQWDCYELDAMAVPFEQSYRNVLQWLDRQGTDYLYGNTQLLIAPGYKYRVVHQLITNFHQPKSTLLLLVTAMVGEQWRHCYQYALDNDFRFLSYGDSCYFQP